MRRDAPGHSTTTVHSRWCSAKLAVMEHTHLGRTGLPVSRLCLGTMTFGTQSDEAGSFAIMDAAAEAGINFIDTANVYPLGAGAGERGETERIVGRWLRGRRHRFILATKGGAVM